MVNVKDFVSRFSLSHPDMKEPVVITAPEEVTSVALVRINAPSRQDRGSFFSKQTAKFVSRVSTSSIIAEDMVIDGSITSGSNLLILGTINGDVNCEGDIEIKGRINGNTRGRNITMNTAEITGDVLAENMLTLAEGSVNGAVSARKADINGMVRGNINIGGLLQVKANATIQGDITAASVSIAKESIIKGNLTISKV